MKSSLQHNAAKTLLTLDPRVFVLGNTGSIENNAAECFEDLTTGDDTLPDIEIKSTDPMAIVIRVEVQACQRRFGILYYIGAAIRYAEIAEATENDVHFANSFFIGGQQFAITGPLYTGMTGIMEKWFSASDTGISVENTM